MLEDFSPAAPFLTPTSLLTSMAGLKEAVAAAAVAGAKCAGRIAVVMMAVQHVVLLRWAEMETYAVQHADVGVRLNRSGAWAVVPVHKRLDQRLRA